MQAKNQQTHILNLKNAKWGITYNLFLLMKPTSIPFSRFHPAADAFTCLACGTCCKWPGPVRLLEEDIQALSSKLNMVSSDFVNQYTTLTQDHRHLTLTEKPDGSCIFLEDNKCIVYETRPRQCRDFPLNWTFQGVENECPGVRAALDHHGGKH